MEIEISITIKNRKTEKPGFRPASVYENKVFTLCVAGAAPQTYANSHTRNTAFHTINTATLTHPHYPASHQYW
jgi:hypothetical protein